MATHFNFRQGAYRAHSLHLCHVAPDGSVSLSDRESKKGRGNRGGGPTESKWWDGSLNRIVARWMAAAFLLPKRADDGESVSRPTATQNRSSYVRGSRLYHVIAGRWGPGDPTVQGRDRYPRLCLGSNNSVPLADTPFSLSLRFVGKAVSFSNATLGRAGWAALLLPFFGFVFKGAFP